MTAAVSGVAVEIRWAAAFAVAVTVGLLAARAVRQAKPVNRLTGEPRPRPSYLGALPVVAGTVAGTVLAPGLLSRTVIVLVAAMAVAFVTAAYGSNLSSGAGLVATCVAAAFACSAAGVRLEATGSAVFDGALTVLWLPVAMWAVAGVARFDDDRLVAIVAAVSAVAVFGLAAFGGSDATATLAAATVGATLAFLVHYLDPDSLPVGDAGRLFLGFVLAASAVEAPTATGVPATILVPFLILAVPLIDLAALTVARARRGRSLRTGRGGHLARCLGASGLSSGPVIAVLVGVQMLLVGVAVLLGRNVVPAAYGAGAALVAVVALTATAAKARLYPEKPTGIPKWAWRAALILVAVPLALAVPAGAAILMSRSQVESASAAVQKGLDAQRKGDSRAAAELFASARTGFEAANRRLSGPLPSLGLAVPLVAPNLRALRTLVDSAEKVARAGQRVSASATSGRLRIVGGKIAFDEVRAVAVELQEANQTLRVVSHRMERIRRDFLLGGLRRTIDRNQVRLSAAVKDSQAVVDAARLAPAILGSDGARHYLLAVQNNAELRATGGLIGDYGELTFEGGAGHLDRFGRIAELIDGGAKSERVLHAPPEYVARYGQFGPARALQNVNMTPDFPTAGAILADLYPQSGGRAVDGVLAIDPFGLAALLQLTGPVEVAPWPEPISAENVVDITLRAAYATFDNTGRIDFLGNVAKAVVERVTTADLGEPARMAFVLGSAVRDRHLMLYLTRPEEQSLVQRIGLGGDLPQLQGDSMLVVNQNAVASKVDFYLHRRVKYSAHLQPSGGTARLSARLEVTLDNTAPAEGLPRYVIGPNAPNFEPGENYTFFSAYVPTNLVSADLDGAPTTFESASELGRNAYSSFISIPARSTRKVGLDLEGTVGLSPGGWYDFRLYRQPLVMADDVDIEIDVPAGWRIAETKGIDLVEAGRARGSFQLEGGRTVAVRLERLP